MSSTENFPRRDELKELMLRVPRLTLGVAESLTCGRVQALVGGISGASGFFRGGITAYGLEQKVRHLGVDRVAAAVVDAVSAEVAVQMARGACTFFGSDLGLATTGYAEAVPERGVGEPFAYWALAHVQGGGAVVLCSGRVDCPGLARAAVQERVAATALHELVEYLEGWRA